MIVRRRLLAAAAAVLSLPNTLVRDALAQPAPLRVRQNVRDFSQDAAKVAALRSGVARMKAVSRSSPDDPAGWTYWASIHGVTDAPPASLATIYAQCDHTWFDPPPHIATHFLSWHRAYLFFFEQTLKAAAAASGAPTPFELPYWNWYADGDLPPIFAQGDEATNPLWHPREAAGVDPSSLERDFFRQRALLPESVPGWRRSFTVPLELNPHGAVHGVVGGDMGFTATSARDPIFWLHHANIDRLWTSWIRQNSGQTNPGPSTDWGRSRFRFDLAGTMTARTSDITETETVLGYRYDNYQIGPPAAPVAAPASRAVRSVVGNPVAGATVSASPGGQARRAISRTPQVVLRDDIVAIDLKMTSGGRQGLAALARGTLSPQREAWVVLEDLRISQAARKGGFSYTVTVALPDRPDEDIRLAEINTFFLSMHGHRGQHRHGPDAPGERVDIALPLHDVLKALGVTDSGRLNAGLRVYFRPVHRMGQGPADPVAFGAVTLSTSSPP